jgi:hypothetical protein
MHKHSNALGGLMGALLPLVHNSNGDRLRENSHLNRDIHGWGQRPKEEQRHRSGDYSRWKPTMVLLCVCGRHFRDINHLYARASFVSAL